MALSESHRGVKGFIILTLLLRQDGNVWTAECRELGTATYADSFEEAHRELVELVELHLNTLEQTGEREYFFEKNGIRCYIDNPPTHIKQRLKVADQSFVHAHSFRVPCPV